MDEKILRQYNSELEAAEACSFLIAAGVRARVVNDASGGQFPDLQIDSGVGLAVASADLGRAEDLLEELEENLG